MRPLTKIFLISVSANYIGNLKISNFVIGYAKILIEEFKIKCTQGQLVSVIIHLLWRDRN